MTCRDCDRKLADGHAVHVARGLCCRCYWRRWRDGTLVDVERVYHPNAEVLAELEHLDLDQSLPLATRLRLAAPRLGMTFEALEKAWYRAKRRELVP